MKGIVMIEGSDGIILFEGIRIFYTLPAILPRSNDGEH